MSTVIEKKNLKEVNSKVNFLICVFIKMGELAYFPAPTVH